VGSLSSESEEAGEEYGEESFEEFEAKR